MTNIIKIAPMRYRSAVIENRSIFKDLDILSKLSFRNAEEIIISIHTINNKVIMPNVNELMFNIVSRRRRGDINIEIIDINMLKTMMIAKINTEAEYNA
jgi:hypothetical protein